ncbi:glutamate--tRNA ligase [Pseudoalteromonas tunicata]|jgi:glutamyl-tRNA synthetase|uniref:Glutamate--tRNA ligase n=1 Tax=Pseudoalteromonas tunicata D2 TaxID=87626 RepID=A4C719_9GAMM|nr:glutamate--tRNA ligase [Pseudoalteromonas tunicata]ATC95743.1 glutamyl-tRNA synthetase [Pseudoalteromonas tunicata]AXT31297.1 glutamate--tRNA ligase [Pseudoalteromonas tunicata]EAR29773.1 Glutamyl-tRNA synthetase (Glutamate-tRNA ligase) [Pseudoalteromonas tunicata D2]MDP4985678.1 glutamate--tRNA ligase [Pseudoalteromonas tunicata]
MTIRTRVAPSPTGDPHLGTAYIALFNYCFAKQQGGEFVLRIEDTDQVRSTRESEQAIMDSLKWLGLNWDHGPDVGGEFGPYRQSERSELYRKYAHQLVEAGKAFYCFATSEELDQMRDEQVAAGLRPKYDGRGLKLSAQEVAENLAAGKPYVIRMNIPEEGTFVFEDYLRGDIEIPWENVDMQVLLKADGFPTYFLANVVDDHHMEISHIFRGEEWINSAPKLLKLYQDFGWTPPVLGHLPLLRNPDKSKLSKRKNPTSINYYKEMGFLPEALLNYLGRMGWSMPDEREKFTLDDMIEHFDIKRVSLGGPIFDIDKLNWLNGLWIRENLTDEQLIQRFLEWKFNADLMAKVIPQAKTRINTLSDLVELAGHFVAGIPTYDPALLSAGKADADVIRQALQIFIWELEALRTWDKNEIFTIAKAVATHHELKIKEFLEPIFVAISGKTSSTSVVDAMEILGSDMSRARLRAALGHLGVSKKQAKAFEKAYQVYQNA